MSKTNIYLAGVALCITILAILTIRPFYVNANPDQIIENRCGGATCSASLATTTTGFMTIGTATSTNTVDTQSDGGLPGKSATLFVLFNGSSTASVLNIAIEYSQNNVDWYGDVITGTQASTSAALSLGNTATFSWTYASTSVGGATSKTDPAYRAFTIPVPARYVRAVFSMASTTVISATAVNGNGSVFSDFIVKKEQR